MTVEISNTDVIMERCQELATQVMRHTEDNGNGIHPTAIEQLDLTRSDAVSTALHSVFQPILALVVQGQKQALLGEETYQYGAGQYLVVSVDLPMSGFVTQATPDKPYLGLKLSLDPIQLCDLVAQMSPSWGKKENSLRGISVDFLLLFREQGTGNRKKN